MIFHLLTRFFCFSLLYPRLLTKPQDNEHVGSIPHKDPENRRRALSVKIPNSDLAHITSATAHYRSPMTLWNRIRSATNPCPMTMTLQRPLQEYHSKNWEETPLTISKVHTLRIHTFNFPCTPSTPSNSTPSHQHLLAGFRQKSNSFCAIPTAFASPPAEPRMSVRSRANAREQMTALFGSGAR